MLETLSKEEFTRRYPTGSYEGYLDGVNTINAFYSMPAAKLNAAMVAAADENKTLNFTND